MNTYINHLLKKIPHQPGVYRMKNSEGTVIYIGKAKDLFKRVNSYFRQVEKHPPRTAKMVENISDIEYTVTPSELEALILETTLIKENRPKYNILMKDDKNYAYIKITVNEDYPRILIVRKVIKDGAKYYGPKTTASKIYQTLKLLRKIFPYRTCNLELEDKGPSPAQTFEKNRIVKVTNATIKYPCLDLHIKRCLGPCVGKPDIIEYREIINQIINFLDGKYTEVLAKLKAEMLEAAQNKKFEQAAKIRDKILNIESIFEKQIVSNPNHQNSDVINYFLLEDTAYFNLFQIREGKLIDQQNVTIKKPLEQGSEQLISSFIQQFYTDAADLPQEILIPSDSENNEILENWLSENAGHRVHLKVPQRGQKEELLDMSLENAFNYAKQSKARFEGEIADQREQALTNLQQLLKLDKKPKRLECYDISHLGGTHTVASMSVFENGFPKTDQYRHFKISLDTPGAPDDFLSMEEVILRRLKYLKPSLATKGFKITKTKTSYQAKLDKAEVAKFNTGETNKLKTFITNFTKPKANFETIIKKITEKFDSKRIYFQILKKDLRDYEVLGFQEVKIPLTEYKSSTAKTAIVYDKTRNFEDPSFKRVPDLIVIDGGKGQLSHAVKAMTDHSLQIPIISLAKKQEEIFIPTSRTPLILQPNDPTRLMIQHLRDEAHRFAIEYNRKLRKNDLTSSELTEIPGIGPKLSKKLLRKYGSLSAVSNLPLEELAETVGPKLAQKIKSNLK